MSSEDVARLQEQVKTLFDDGKETKDALKDLSKEVKALREKLSERLPNWAALLIATLTASIGWLVGK